MKEGSEGDGGGGIDDLPTSRDADSTVSNGNTNGPRMVKGPSSLAVHEGLPFGAVHESLHLGGTALANALLGFSLDRSKTNGNNNGSNGDALLGIHSTNTTIVKGNGNSNGQNREKQFPCNICHRSFGYKHVLQNHERTHTGEKPFECKECHKRFTRDHHLKTHMRLHTGEKPYHCSHCERQFVQVANLRRHLRVHTGERPYACSLCTSRFSDSNQLKAHVLIHEGKKPFECEKCGGHFRRRHHLVHHKCPKDEANIGKPRRGRRPKAYDELPTLLSPVLQERLSAPIVNHQLLPPPPVPVEVSLTSVIKRESSSPSSLLPQPAHIQKSINPSMIMRNYHSSPIISNPISNHLLLNLSNTNGGSHFHDAVQTGPLDMTVSSASAPVSVIVPRIQHPSYQHPTSNNSMDGVLDLSHSRSDSEAEPIEEEVDEEDDCIDEGMDSDSEEEHLLMIACSWKRGNNHVPYNNHTDDLRRVNGDRYSEETREDRYSEENRDDRYSEGNRDDNYCNENREEGYCEGNGGDRYSEG